MRRKAWTSVEERVGERMAQTDNTRPNHAVGEVYKPNIHDPHEMYKWEEPVSAWVWAGRALFCLGLFVGSYVLTLLTFLL